METPDNQPGQERAPPGQDAVAGGQTATQEEGHGEGWRGTHRECRTHGAALDAAAHLRLFPACAARRPVAEVAGRQPAPRRDRAFTVPPAATAAATAATALATAAAPAARRQPHHHLPAVVWLFPATRPSRALVQAVAPSLASPPLPPPFLPLPSFQRRSVLPVCWRPPCHCLHHGDDPLQVGCPPSTGGG